MAAKSTLEIIINGTTKGAEKAFDKVGSAISGLGKAAIGIGVGAAAGIAALGAAAVKLAIDAAPLQGVQAAFNGIAEAAGKGGDEMLAALQKGSAGMITNRDLMTSFNKAASLVSQDFAVKLPDAMQYLGKVSAATGQDMGFLMDSLVTGIGRLSPMILDNLGIQVDLTAATEAYAASVGKSADELTKTEQQTALMNQVLEKLAETTKDIPDMMGGANQSWESFKVTLQNTKDAIGVALLPIFNELLSVVLEGAQTYLPILVNFIRQELVPKLFEWWEFVEENLIPVLTVLWEWVQENLPKAIKVLVDFWNNTLKPALTALWNFIKDNVIPIIETWVGWLQDETPGAMQALVDFWNNTLKPALQAIWKFLSEDLNPIWQALADLFGTIADALWPALTSFWENSLKPMLESLWGWVENKLIPAFENWSESMGGIEGVVESIAGAIRRLTDAVKSLISWYNKMKAKRDELEGSGVTPYNPREDYVGQDALGGPVMKGTPYAVGNELFVPNTSGYIVNNWNLTANYAYQSPNNLVQEIRLLEMLHT